MNGESREAVQTASLSCVLLNDDLFERLLAAADDDALGKICNGVDGLDVGHLGVADRDAALLDGRRASEREGTSSALTRMLSRSIMPPSQSAALI